MLHQTAEISDQAQVAKSAKIWSYAQIRENAVVGENTVIGRNVYLGSGVEVGDNCKIQNNSLIYEPAWIGNGVFIGPDVVLTNDHNPRAINSDFTIKSASDWEPVGVEILNGASIGAGSICVAPVQIGEWALVAAGSVVIDDVPAFALVAGVPAKQIGWVGKSGFKLDSIGENLFQCPKSKKIYVLSDGNLMENQSA